jgi:CRP-like cAMP-binding protein
LDPGRLKQIPLFSTLDDEELRRISALAAENSVPEGARLVQKGDFAYELFAIEEGTAEVQRDGQTVAELGPGDFFGESGVVQKELRNADVVATSPMRVVVLSRWDVRRLRKNLPDLDEQLQRVIAERTSG